MLGWRCNRGIKQLLSPAHEEEVISLQLWVVFILHLVHTFQHTSFYLNNTHSDFALLLPYPPPPAVLSSVYPSLLKWPTCKTLGISKNHTTPVAWLNTHTGTYVYFPCPTLTQTTDTYVQYMHTDVRKCFKLGGLVRWIEKTERWTKTHTHTQEEGLGEMEEHLLAVQFILIQSGGRAEQRVNAAHIHIFSTPWGRTHRHTLHAYIFLCTYINIYMRIFCINM